VLGGSGSTRQGKLGGLGIFRRFSFHGSDASSSLSDWAVVGRMPGSRGSTSETPFGDKGRSLGVR
jgi:hypothetical protein